jgi:ABC-type glycerol-3-phosphate transport system substrate-binding protein
MTKAPRAILLSGAVALTAAGCGGGGSDAEQARQDLVSWSGTLAIAAEQWGRGLDPTPYTRTVSEAARAAVRKTTSDLARQVSQGDGSVAALQAAAQRLEAGRRSLDAAISHRDGPAAVALAGELEALRRQLRTEP